LAHGLVQMAVHFPDELASVELTAEQALSRAVELAEESIALAPRLPDGHCALGRALLCSDEPGAIEDAAELLRHALALDPEHDSAVASLAAALLALGRAHEALALAERLQKLGNGLPHALLLRALAYAELGRTEEARRDLARALKLAPEAGLLYLDAARVATTSGDEAAASEHLARARELLASAYDETIAALELS
jgi:tetratricopeptide (TPR) repeat protein